MNKQLIELKDAKDEAGFEGSLSEFKKSKELVQFCIKNKKIVRVTSPTQMNLDFFHEYHAHLMNIARSFVKSEKIDSWALLEAHPEMGKVTKILHDFGVRAELFDAVPIDDKESEEPEVTVNNLWTLAKIHYGFKGSETSFKSWLQDQYGSVAEYCLIKNLPINVKKWESQSTAIRVAKKLGSVNNIKIRSKSLFRYLESEGLLSEIDLPESSSDSLIADLIAAIWSNKKVQKSVLDKWYIDSAISKFGDTSGVAEIKKLADELSAALSPEELGLLYYDIGLVFDEDGSPSDSEKKTTMILDKAWRSKMTPYAEQAMRFRKNPFEPYSLVSAIGYVLFQAVSVDGNIQVDEVLELKKGLLNWQDVSIRNILAAVNFCLHGSKDDSILGLEHILKIQTKSEESIINCCGYISEHGNAKLCELLVKHVKEIVQADGIIHENEKWLVETIAAQLKAGRLAS